jgi:hypothetical protein
VLVGTGVAVGRGVSVGTGVGVGGTVLVAEGIGVNVGLKVFSGMGVAVGALARKLGKPQPKPISARITNPSNNRFCFTIYHSPLRPSILTHPLPQQYSGRLGFLQFVILGILRYNPSITAPW